MIETLVRTTSRNGFRALTLIDEADQEQVDAEVAERRDDDLSEDVERSVAAERRDRSARDHRGDREDGRVVGDADRRPVLDDVHDRRREADDDAGLPAVEHDAAVQKTKPSETPPVSIPSSGTG